MPGIGPDDAARHPGQVGAASPALFTGLLDCPLDLPLDGQLVAHRSAWYAGLLGAVVVPAELADQVGQTAPDLGPLRIVAAEGLAQARAVSSTDRSTATSHVVAVELPMDAVDDLAAAWAELGAGGRSVWWGVDPDGHPREQLGRLAGAAGAMGAARAPAGGLSLPVDAVTEADLATLVRHAIDLDLGFTLTGGPTRGRGVLGMLCAVKAALNGAEEPELAELLAERDPEPLVERTHAMSEADASVIRAFWASCGGGRVAEVAAELAELGVVAGPTTAQPRYGG